MLDAASFDTGGQTRADFLRQLRGDFLAQEGGHPRRVGGQHRPTRQRVVQRHQSMLAAKHQVGGVFHLADAPVIALLEYVKYRAQPLRIAIKAAMQHIGTEGVGERLRAWQVGHSQESIVFLDKIDAFPFERTRQGAVAVPVELQAKRRPGRHPQIAQREFLVDEVKVMVQTLARLRAQKRLATGLVVPRPVPRTSLHRRDYVHQIHPVATQAQHPRHQLFLADVALADVFDLHRRRRTHFLRPLAYPISQWLGKARGVEDANLVRIQKARHPARVTCSRQGAGDNHPVVARQHSMKIRRIPIAQRRIHGCSPHHHAAANLIPCLVPARPA